MENNLWKGADIPKRIRDAAAKVTTTEDQHDPTAFDDDDAALLAGFIEGHRDVVLHGLVGAEGAAGPDFPDRVEESSEPPGRETGTAEGSVNRGLDVLAGVSCIVSRYLSAIVDCADADDVRSHSRDVLEAEAEPRRVRNVSDRDSLWSLGMTPATTRLLQHRGIASVADLVYGIRVLDPLGAGMRSEVLSALGYASQEAPAYLCDASLELLRDYYGPSGYGFDMCGTLIRLPGRGMDATSDARTLADDTPVPSAGVAADIRGTRAEPFSEDGKRPAHYAIRRAGTSADGSGPDLLGGRSPSAEFDAILSGFDPGSVALASDLLRRLEGIGMDVGGAQAPEDDAPGRSILLVEDAVGLSTWARNALTRAGIASLDDLASMTEDEIAGIRGIGVKCLFEIKEYMASNGMRPQGAPAGPMGSAGVHVNREAFLISTLPEIERLRNCDPDLGVDDLPCAHVGTSELERRLVETIGRIVHPGHVRPRWGLPKGPLWDRAAELFAASHPGDVVYDESDRTLAPVVTTLPEWLGQLPPSLEDIVRHRIVGRTLQQIADWEGLTRERIRQKIEKAFQSRPGLVEDRLLGPYAKYRWAPGMFRTVFEVDGWTCGYLAEATRRVRRSTEPKPVVAALSDDALTDEERDRLRAELGLTRESRSS